MHEVVIQKWNKQVKSKDIVYVLGDVTFGRWEETKEVLSKLNGRKILIRGNHDERFTSAQWIALGFEDVRDIVVVKKSSNTAQPGEPAEKWILNHYPYSSSFKYYYYKYFRKRRSEAGYYKLFLPYKGYKMLHGHHHDGPEYKHDQVNVAWDVHGKLLNENEVLEIFTKNKVSGFKKLLNMIKLILW